MYKNFNKIDDKALKRLQTLSEKISDLIHRGSFDKVVELDIERKKIIKCFNEKPQKEAVDILKYILAKNKTDIMVLEMEKEKLTKNYNLSIKTFQAYSK